MLEPITNGGRYNSWYGAGMASPDSQLHVIFSRSARGSLEQALALAGRTDVAVAPYDDLSLGPIARYDALARDVWVEEALGYRGWRKTVEDSLPVLAASSQSPTPPIVWISPDNAQSVAGFLWWLSYQGERDCLVLEAPRLHTLHAEELLEHLDRMEPLPATRRTEWLASWARLQAEDAPLRVLDTEGALVSAPLDHFDARLLKHATGEWQKMALIVGTALGEFAESGRYQASDMVLHARLAGLAEAGTLEWRGDLGVMWGCEVRLAE